MSAQLESSQVNLSIPISKDLMRLDNLNAAKTKTEAALTLLENGMILHCNDAAGTLLGCAPSKLTWQPVSRLLPQLVDISLLQDDKVNPYLRFLSIAGHCFECVKSDGVHFACELFFSVVKELGRSCLNVRLHPIRQGQATTLRHLRTY